MAALPHSAAANVPWRADQTMIEVYPQRDGDNNDPTGITISVGDFLVWGYSGQVKPTAIAPSPDAAASALLADGKAATVGIAGDASPVADHYGVWRTPRAIRALRAGQIWAPLRLGTGTASAHRTGTGTGGDDIGQLDQISAINGSGFIGARAAPVTTGSAYYQVTGHRGHQAQWSAILTPGVHRSADGTPNAFGTIINTRFEEGEFQALILFDFNALNNVGGLL